MKKLLIILALLATGMCARSQVDTLFLGDRDPVYYYWDRNWWDYLALNHPVGREINWMPGSTQDSRWCKNEYARYCYTDSSLRVIGIAAALKVKVHKPYQDQPFPDSIYIGKMMTEYFRVYEVDSTIGETDEMRLVAQGSWNSTIPPRHYMLAEVNRETPPLPNPPNPASPLYYPIYEVYFDSAVTVYDSFYVAITGNNNYVHSNYMDYYAIFSIGTINPDESTDRYDSVPYECYPHPNHFRKKMHLIDERNYDFRYMITDTNWHTFACYSHRPDDTLSEPFYVPYRDYIYMFPIIDTSRIVPPPACHTPNGLTLVYANGGVATLSWQSGNAVSWELSVCADGCEPEYGIITQWSGLIATLQNLDTARWYAARVRSVCSFGDSTYYSDWSDSVMFYVPGNGGVGIIETTVDRYTYLMPNPASETVTLASSFRIGDVEVYDLNGKRLMRQSVDAMQTVLDLSSIPSGTYIVRVTTNNGTAYKKLVVR